MGHQCRTPLFSSPLYRWCLPLVLGILACSSPAVAAPAQAAQARPEARHVLPGTVTPERYRIAIVPDASALNFKGSVVIDLVVHAPTDRIVLNALDLKIDTARLSGEADSPAIGYDETAQTASFRFAHRLGRGPHRLTLEYQGRIYPQGSGLFALDYETPAGKARALFTQFESADARRFVPCWDEPGRKAVFELSAVVPQAQMAISNTPVAATENLADGLKRVTFGATPRMSSYLLFFGAGDFERVHRDVDGVDVGVVVKRGDTASATYALDAAAALLPWYNEYFGAPFPLPKLDMIAAPGEAAFGAMENWGAILYFERVLLIDPRISTLADRQEVFQVVAHEMAHQWFGDLVTMAWWDDLWLNEGFASWMQKKATDHFHPEWRIWLGGMEGTQEAMDIDAREGTHPVITPIRDVLETTGTFDRITYQKGAAVIRMLESYLGQDAFRAGVRRYMHRHAYGNAVTDELWAELDRGARRPVLQIAHDFTLHAGVPMVTATDSGCTGRTRTVTLSQGQFAIDEDRAAAHDWHVPVTFAPLGGAPLSEVVAGAGPHRARLAGCGALILNAGQAAYFRSRYPESGLSAILDHFGELPPEDQFGIMSDTSHLALAGLEDMGAALELFRRVPPDSDPLVLRSLVGNLQYLDRIEDGLPGQPAYRRFARALLGPILSRVGWNATDGESDNTGLLRLDLIAALGDFGDPAVLAEARTRFDRFVSDAGSLDASTRHIVLGVVAAHADAGSWDALHRMALSARTQLERQEFYQLLAASGDAALVQRALELAMSAEPPETSGPQMIDIAARHYPGMAFGFAKSHWDALEPKVGTQVVPYYIPRILNEASDPDLIDQLDAFAAQHIPANARQELRKTESNIRYRARIRAARLPEVDRWLAQHDPSDSAAAALPARSDSAAGALPAPSASRLSSLPGR